MAQVKVGDGCLGGCAVIFIILMILIIGGFIFFFSTIGGIIFTALFILYGIIKLISKTLK